MPTQTCWNLPADKRETLIAAGLEAFANNDYDEVERVFDALIDILKYGLSAGKR